MQNYTASELLRLLDQLWFDNQLIRLNFKHFWMLLFVFSVAILFLCDFCADWTPFPSFKVMKFIFIFNMYFHTSDKSWKLCCFP